MFYFSTHRTILITFDMTEPSPINLLRMSVCFFWWSRGLLNQDLDRQVHLRSTHQCSAAQNGKICRHWNGCQQEMEDVHLCACLGVQLVHGLDSFLRVYVQSGKRFY